MRGTTIAALLLLVVAGIAYTPQGGNDRATVTVHGDPPATLELAVADTAAERREGLMYRSTLPHDGMLFVYDGAARRTFWMKDTHIPLDIIFVGPDLRVLNVEQADVPDDPASPTERYRSDGAAMYVIETRQGFAAAHDVSRGTRVALE